MSISLLPDRAEIVRFVHWLHAPGSVIELRALDGRQNTWSGYFDRPDALADWAVKLSANCHAIYVTLNAMDPRLIARRANRVIVCGRTDATTAKANIVRRVNLLIDVDPLRPSGISSTDAEHDAAIAKAHEIAATFAGQRFMVADSGNGAHVLVKIDRPADDGGVVERSLKALAAQFDDAVVHVDTGVHDPARITKLIGTVARKGDCLPQYPHRLSRILQIGGGDA